MRTNLFKLSKYTHNLLNTATFCMDEIMPNHKTHLSKLFSEIYKCIWRSARYCKSHVVRTTRRIRTACAQMWDKALMEVESIQGETYAAWCNSTKSTSPDNIPP